jgi:hypothetical protein
MPHLYETQRYFNIIEQQLVSLRVRGGRFMVPGRTA